MATGTHFRSSAQGAISILVSQAEFDALDERPSDYPRSLDASTSVSRVKRDFLEALSAAGSVRRIDAQNERELREARTALASLSPLRATKSMAHNPGNPTQTHTVPVAR